MTNPDRIPLSESEAAAEARRLIEDAYRPALTLPTTYRDTSPIPAIGSNPPVAQPGRPPMSQRATDASTLMLTAGIASPLLGGSLSLVLWTAGHLDPLTVALICGAPAAILGALSRVLKSAKSAIAATPTEHHHHYNGPVIQEHRNITSTSTTRGLVARTNNDIRN
ncbi:hypothetical protein [Streptomyces sp. SPB4]|uniref:hypothetical protein n=1 Tax=Streptomyces sp. SPB4 TaxID=2940553 RepID=UPI0024743690|nr:hypothetical protein [Streptomyces sp. SPB4]MDH6544959.1 hypothetical protein [Streptomyces sp. SPB4]